MSLLNLRPDFLAFNVLGILWCFVLAVVCVCRLNASLPKRGRVTAAQLVYVLFAFWAMGTLMDLWRGQVIGFHNAAGGAGIALYLWLTYRAPGTPARRAHDVQRGRDREGEPC